MPYGITYKGTWRALFSWLINLKYVYIYLGGNKLQYLHPNAFLWLPNLIHISLHNNPGLQIPTDCNFMNSRSLSSLDISRRNVISVSVETFAKVSSLEWLDLRHNNLRTVDINILRALPKLSTLYLYGNRVQCDCQLQKVWRYCEDRNIQAGFRGKEPKCDTPSEVKGIEWVVVEKSQCLVSNINFYRDYNNTS